MRRILKHILLTLCLLTPSITWTQEAGKALLRLSEESDGTRRMEFTLGNVELTAVGDGQQVAVTADGLPCRAPQAGLPALPQASRLIVLPRGTQMALNDVDCQHLAGPTLPTGQLLSPWQGGSVKDVELPTAAPDKEAYGTNRPLTYGDAAELKHLGTMGMHEVYRLTVNPVAYNPVSGSLTLCSRITATLTTTGHETQAMPKPTGAGRLLVVARTEFREGLQPFVRWKRQEGYTVEELYVATHLRDSIKAMIAPWFRYPALMPTHLLLVGDAGQIQSFIGTTCPEGLSQHTTDLYYAEHTGDYLPDALMGRWPVNDTAELRAVVEKTLRYEQCREMDSMQLNRLLLVAGRESQTPAPITTNGQVNYLSREAAAALPGIDTVVYRNPSSGTQRDAILHDLSLGASVLNYTAHCSVGGWSDPSVTFTSIDTLETTQPLFYINNCCKSNTFSGTCFGEQLLRKPAGGAIGVIGATNSTLWEEDYYWSVGPKFPYVEHPAYDPLHTGAGDRLLASPVEAAELLTTGNLAVSAFGSPYDKFYWEIYCLFGDPTLRPWIRMPVGAMLQTDSAVTDGACHLAFTVTAGAIVTAMQHDTVIGLGRADSVGQVAFSLSHCVDTTPLVVTVSGPGLRPYTDTLAVSPCTGRGAALRDVSTSDSIIAFRIENCGTFPLYHLYTALVQTNEDSLVGAVLQTQQAFVDTLMPGESRSLTLPIEIAAIGSLPLWQARLTVGDSTGAPLCSLAMQQPMEVDYPTATFFLTGTDSTATRQLRPRQAYLLGTAVESLYDSLRMTLTSLPSGDTLCSSSVVSQDSLSVFFLPFTTPDTLTHLHIEACLHVGNHVEPYSHYLVGGLRMDSFEEGFASYPWQQGGTQPWTLDSTSRHGRFSARSGAIDYRQTSDLLLEVLLGQADSISFWARTSSEARYDKLLFSIDGEQCGTALSGESGWQRFAYGLTAGRHTLRWRYVKDESGSAGNDCAWIDDVSLPMALWDSAYGWFGDLETLTITPQPAPAEGQRLAIYPNPADGRVTMAGPAHGWLSVSDLYGRKVYTHPYTLQLPAILDLGFLPDGVYFVTVGSENSLATGKLIIKHNP